MGPNRGALTRPSTKVALDTALRNHAPSPGQECVVALAKRLAIEVDQTDDPEVVVKRAPRLMATLDVLGMTGAGALRGGAQVVPHPALDELRIHRARFLNPPAVDPTSP